MYTDMCMGICMDKGTDMCTDMCMDVCMRLKMRSVLRVGSKRPVYIERPGVRPVGIPVVLKCYYTRRWAMRCPVR